MMRVARSAGRVVREMLVSVRRRGGRVLVLSHVASGGRGCGGMRRHNGLRVKRASRCGHGEVSSGWEGGDRSEHGALHRKR